MRTFSEYWLLVLLATYIISTVNRLKVLIIEPVQLLRHLLVL